MKIYSNFSQIVTMKEAFLKNGRKLSPPDLSIIENASIAFDQEKILWVGKNDEIPSDFKNRSNVDCSGMVLTPELVDSHTHLIFGGDRSIEYAQRLNGKSYEEIAASGGGILYTVSETLKLSESELYQISLERINEMFKLGVGSIEIKTGYALTIEGEKKLLNVIDKLKKDLAPKIQIFSTFMGAHAIPKNQSAMDYIKNVVLPVMNESKSKIDAVDIFHEVSYFTTEETQMVFLEAKKLKIPIKIHADEFNDNNGAKLACDSSALSADHLLKVSSIGIESLAKSNTVATLLPGTALFLGKPWAPARQMLNAGVAVAIASDFNPGSCHFNNLLKIASMAAPSLKMNQAELWAAITLNAARALGYNQQGAIIEGLKPRFSIFNTPDLSNITYHWSKNFSHWELL